MLANKSEEVESSDSKMDEGHLEQSSDDDTSGVNPSLTKSMAWAQAMCNVLNTTPKSEHFILSKAKQDSDIKVKKRKEIELVDSNDNVIVEEKKSVKSPSEMRKKMRENQKKKAEWEAMCRVKPDIVKKEKEKEFVKIATRGVVHLFNSVEEHQKKFKTSKKEFSKPKQINAVKGAFMDILKQHSKKDNKKEEDVVVVKVEKEETWNILKDDFMMRADMKDWDKASDDET